MTRCAYADQCGWLPVIDIPKGCSQYHYDDGNMWEYYFEQPAGYGLEDIARSQNVTLCWRGATPAYINYRAEVWDTEFVQKLYRCYIRFNPTTQEYLAADERRFLGGAKILGCLCRGTDYLNKYPARHPIQPNPVEVILKCEQVMSDYGCQYLFLATEDAEICDMFKAKFGTRLLHNDQRRYSSGEMQEVQQIYQVREDNAMEKYWVGMHYLSALNVLSKCACFVGGHTTGTLFAHLMPHNFEYDYRYNIGIYPSKFKLGWALTNVVGKILFRQ